MNSGVLVFGGAHLDKEYTLYSEFVPSTSNPCGLEILPGGVGLNIAAHLKSLGLESVSIISAVGVDSSADLVLKACKALGIGTQFIYKEPSESTGEYICGLNPSKEVLFGLANMDIYDAIRFEKIRPSLNLLQQYPYWVIETNFPKEAIQSILSAKREQETFVVATSSAKILKLKGALNHIDHFFLNEHELGTLLDRDVRNQKVCMEGLAELHSKGVKHIYLTRDKRGALVSSVDGSVKEYKALAQFVKRTGGAGDAFASAAIFHYVQSKDIDFSVKSASGYARDLVEGKIDLYKGLKIGRNVP